MSTLKHLWYLCIEVVYVSSYIMFLCSYDFFLIISNSVAACTYLFLRCILSDRYGNTFNTVIMPFLLVLGMHVSLFLLLSISHFCALFVKVKLFSR